MERTCKITGKESKEIEIVYTCPWEEVTLEDFYFYATGKRIQKIVFNKNILFMLVIGNNEFFVVKQEFPITGSKSPEVFILKTGNMPFRTLEEYFESIAFSDD